MSGIPDHLDGFWVDEAGQVWELITYCSLPTMTLKRVGFPDRVGGAVSAPIFNRFTKLKRADS